MVITQRPTRGGQVIDGTIRLTGMERKTLLERFPETDRPGGSLRAHIC